MLAWFKETLRVYLCLCMFFITYRYISKICTTYLKLPLLICVSQRKLMSLLGCFPKNNSIPMTASNVYCIHFSYFQVFPKTMIYNNYSIVSQSISSYFIVVFLNTVLVFIIKLCSEYLGPTNLVWFDRDFLMGLLQGWRQFPNSTDWWGCPQLEVNGLFSFQGVQECKII